MQTQYKVHRTESQFKKKGDQAYWNYINKMILDLPVHELDNMHRKKSPKNLFSYIKNQNSENINISSLREGEY